jgi:signal peptidase II
LGKKVVLLILGVLIIDQLVKVWIKTSLHPHESVPVIDGFFQLYYIENRGMAFGTTLGSGAIGKYALSLFRLGASIAIAIYIRKMILDKTSSKGLIIALSLIFAGATGNLIDGLFYDFIFDIDPNVAWNWAMDSDGNWVLDEFGSPVLRPNGFLLGSVVDMFQFTMTWPMSMESLPRWLGKNLAGKEVFGAIWNVADFAISVGVGLIIIRYKTFFKKKPADLQTGGLDPNPGMENRQDSVVAE